MLVKDMLYQRYAAQTNPSRFKHHWYPQAPARWAYAVVFSIFSYIAVSAYTSVWRQFGSTSGTELQGWPSLHNHVYQNRRIKHTLKIDPCLSFSLVFTSGSGPCVRPTYVKWDHRYQFSPVETALTSTSFTHYAWKGPVSAQNWYYSNSKPTLADTI